MSKCEINSHVGRRVRMERRRRNLTQKELAYACGVSFQVIHKYEAGLVTISAGMLWRMADALSLSVAELFPLREAAGTAARSPDSGRLLPH